MKQQQLSFQYTRMSPFSAKRNVENLTAIDTQGATQLCCPKTTMSQLILFIDEFQLIYEPELSHHLLPSQILRSRFPQVIPMTGRCSFVAVKQILWSRRVVGHPVYRQVGYLAL